jgi:hypothetical protein
VGEDEEERVVRVNEPYIDPETNEQKYFLLDAEKYDVKVNIGPSYTTKRQEAAGMYQELIRSAPELMNVMGDIYFRNSDMAGADEAAERMKRYIGAVNPGLIEDDKKQAEIPPQVQQKLAQYEQLIDQLTENANVLAQERETKKAELDYKRDIEMEKLQIERERLQVQLAIEQLKIGSQSDAIMLREELAAQKHEIEMLQRQQDAERAAEQADIDRAFQADQAAAEQQQQAAGEEPAAA